MKNKDLKEVLIGIVIIFIVLLIFFLGAKYTGFLIYSTQPPSQAFQEQETGQTDYAIQAIQNISSCQNLTNPDTIYRLNQTVTANSTNKWCFKIMAQNITLDCSGHSIISVGIGGAILIKDQQNISVVNCTIMNFASHVPYLGTMHIQNCSGINITNSQVINSSPQEAAIYFRDTTNGVLKNITITNAIGNGISFYNSTDIHLQNSYIANNSLYGVSIQEYSNNITITQNQIHHNSYGIYFDGTPYSCNILNNHFENNTYYSIFFTYFNQPNCNHSIQNNTMEENLLILYYHDASGITVENNDSIGELIFCNISSSSAKNLTIPKETFIVRKAWNLSFSNSIFPSSKYIAMHFANIHDSHIENITVLNASYSALYYFKSSNITHKNLTFFKSGYASGGSALFFEITPANPSENNTFNNFKIYETPNFIHYDSQVTSPNNFTNLTLGYNETFGKVFWPFLNLTFAHINSSTSKFDPELIAIDTTINTQLAQNATLFLYSADTPTIYYASGFYSTKNDIISSRTQCPPTRCSGINYNATTKLTIINLTRFSSYAASYCGDGICAPNEDHSSCPADCPAPPSGGGPSVIRVKPIKAPLACIPSRTIISSTPCVLNISPGAIYGGKKTITYKIINSTCGITYQTVTVSCNPFVALPYTAALPVSVIFIGHFITPSFTTSTPSYTPATGGSAIFVIKHNGSFVLPNVTINVTPNVTEEASPITGKMTSLGITSTKLKGMAYEKCKALFKLQNVSFEKKDLAPNEELKAKIEFTTPWTIFSQIPLIFRLYSNNVPIKDFVYPINVDVPDFMFDIIPSDDSFAVCLLFNPAKLPCTNAAYEFELNLNKNHWTSIADHYGPIRTTKPVLIAYEFSTDPAMLKKIKTASLKLYCKGKIIKKKTIPLWR